MMGYGYGGMGLLGGLIGLIVSIAVLVGIVLLIVWAVRSLDGRGVTLEPTIRQPVAG